MSIIEEKQLEKEITFYKTYAVNTVSIIMITLFFGSLSTENPLQTSLLVFPIAIASIILLTKKFPQTIALLQDSSKKINYKASTKEQIKKVVSNFRIEILTSTEGFIFLFSYTLYMSIACIPGWGLAIKTGSIKAFLF